MPDLLDPSIFTDFTGLPLLQVSNISKDDEFWIVQCPKNVSIRYNWTLLYTIIAYIFS
jgi:hypothetical protein